MKKKKIKDKNIQLTWRLLLVIALSGPIYWFVGPDTATIFWFGLFEGIFTTSILFVVINVKPDNTVTGKDIKTNLNNEWEKDHEQT